LHSRCPSGCSHPTARSVSSLPVSLGGLRLQAQYNRRELDNLSEVTGVVNSPMIEVAESSVGERTRGRFQIRTSWR